MRIPLISILLLITACRGKDGEGDSGTAGTPNAGGNQAPTANAGSDQALPADGAVSLSGAASTDPEGQPLTYYWSFDHVPDGSTITDRSAAFSANHSADAVNTSFTPDRVGTYIVELLVRDQLGLASNPDYVIITVEEPSTAPTAVAGADQTVDQGATVSLDGSRSYDPYGRTLTYLWTIVETPASSTASLSDATSATPTFVADKKGAYTVNLVVNNGLTSSSGDSVSITATAEDGPPEANAGPDQASASDCTLLNLDCSASSDPENDPLQYFWEVQVKPSGSTVSNATFSDRNSATPTFYPDQAGTYVLSCTVFDGTNWSSPDTMTITAEERRTNTPPTVAAGADQTVDAGTATCEASGYLWNCDECGDQTAALGADGRVTDSDGDPLTYLWEVEDGDAEIEAADQLSTQVKLLNIEPEEPGECAEVVYKFRLTVTDCTGASTSDQVRITTTCCGVEDTSSR